MARALVGGHCKGWSRSSARLGIERWVNAVERWLAQHVILRPLARGSVHPCWTRNQKPSPTCRFILWNFANDLRKGGSVVLGKVEAHRELLQPVKTEALLAYPLKRTMMPS
jgi:hypothetical protein